MKKDTTAFISIPVNNTTLIMGKYQSILHERTFYKTTGQCSSKVSSHKRHRKNELFQIKETKDT